MTTETEEKPAKKKKAPFVQPDACVTVPAEEHALCGVDFAAKSEAGLVASLREAMANARWSDASKRHLMRIVDIGKNGLLDQRKAVAPFCHLPRCITEKPEKP